MNTRRHHSGRMLHTLPAVFLLFFPSYQGKYVVVFFFLLGFTRRFRNHWCIDRSTSEKRNSEDPGNLIFREGSLQDEMDGSGGNENPAEETEC